MIKLKLVILCLVISISSFGQKKDTVRIADSLPSISVNDLNDFIKTVYARVGQDDYEKIKAYFQFLINSTEKKRYIITPHK